MALYDYPDKCRRCGVTEDEEEINNFYCEYYQSLQPLWAEGAAEIRSVLPEAERIAEDMQSHIVEMTDYLLGLYPDGKIILEEFHGDQSGRGSGIGESGLTNIHLYLTVKMKSGETKSAADIDWNYEEWESSGKQECRQTIWIAPDDPNIMRREPIQAHLFGDF